eukprot:CAMPEP_0117420200 /NCGR_PEP_ID=MMETSP0758-20121206/1581_1 /TAXON_ID=63605 /ORGANISM="Percolomonas cosmopolitus, Strain AE-1 (ATCC 50343)" /LENGTH=466 /DNA_ID=CAMNT_0005201665 /DNA_START=226 /DNA_END=1626 /DNA_ORIENTATION=-
MLEKLITPFGLVRYGIAPDHQDAKNVENEFTKFVEENSHRFQFFGNTLVGEKGVSIDDLKNYFDIVILATGAWEDKKHDTLISNTDKEGLHRVITSHDLVDFYNGLPEPGNLISEHNTALSPLRSIAIVGHGNVALDIARLFLYLKEDPSYLDQFDIPSSRLSTLKILAEQLENIHLIARRGPMQSKFTIKEYREVTKLIQKFNNLEKKDASFTTPSRFLFNHIDKKSNVEYKEGGRLKQRIFDLMNLSASEAVNYDQRPKATTPVKIHLQYYSDPQSYDSSSRTLTLKNTFSNYIDASSYDDPSVLSNLPSYFNNDVHHLENVDLVVSAIGYRSESGTQIPSPLQSHVNKLSNDEGRIIDLDSDEYIDGLYCTGWVKRGPTGVILVNVLCASETVRAIKADLDEHFISRSGPRPSSAKDFLLSLNPSLTTWDQWKSVSAEEIRIGQQNGKVREKFVSKEQMEQFL